MYIAQVPINNALVSLDYISVCRLCAPVGHVLKNSFVLAYYSMFIIIMAYYYVMFVGIMSCVGWAVQQMGICKGCNTESWPC